MTYRDHLDTLLTVCTEKGKVYLDAKSIPSNGSMYVAHLKRDWEEAEDEFEACLALIMSDKVRLIDVVPALPVSTLVSSDRTYGSHNR